MEKVHGKSEERYSIAALTRVDLELATMVFGSVVFGGRLQCQDAHPLNSIDMYYI